MTRNQSRPRPPPELFECEPVELMCDFFAYSPGDILEASVTWKSPGKMLPVRLELQDGFGAALATVAVVTESVTLLLPLTLSHGEVYTVYVMYEGWILAEQRIMVLAPTQRDEFREWEKKMPQLEEPR